MPPDKDDDALAALAGSPELALCTRAFVSGLRRASAPESSAALTLVLQNLSKAQTDFLKAALRGDETDGPARAKAAVAEDAEAAEGPRAAPIPLSEETLAILEANVLDKSATVRVKKAFDKAKPFHHASITPLLTDDFARELREELVEEEFVEKSNDLYDLFQTGDFKASTTATISRLRTVLYSAEFLATMTAITGIELDPNVVDMHGIIFQRTGTLLCHDDHLSGRRIAYILYLSPDWEESDGGALDLYDTRPNGTPGSVVKSIVPVWDSFVFFAVTPESYHRVAEVISDKVRLSISGWFHGAPVSYPEAAPWSPPVLCPLAAEVKTTLADWINPDYLKPKTKKGIAKFFEESSHVRLENFLLPKKYDAVRKALEPADWRRMGPPIRHEYNRLNADSGPVAELEQLLCSTAFGAFLKEITQLEVATAAVETRCFRRGDYTLLHDNAGDMEALDAVLSFTNESWEVEWGGTTNYTTADTQLLMVEPARNTLSLMFRTSKAMSFVKYVNHLAPVPRYDMIAMYQEPEAMRGQTGAEEEDEEDDGAVEEDASMDGSDEPGDLE